MKIKDYKLSEVKEMCATVDSCAECQLFNNKTFECGITELAPRDWYIDADCFDNKLMCLRKEKKVNNKTIKKKSTKIS